MADCQFENVTVYLLDGIPTTTTSTSFDLRTLAVFPPFRSQIRNNEIFRNYGEGIEMSAVGVWFFKGKLPPQPRRVFFPSFNTN